MEKFDVIVAGAGNAGLIAAIKCALAGKKTLLIEQHNLPGGCATSFRRGRFEFEPSLHELCGVGTKENPGEVLTLFDEIGVEMNWCSVPDCFRVIGFYSDGTPMDVTMPFGKEKFLDAIEGYVPGCRDSVAKMFELFDEVTEGLDYLSAHPDFDPKYVFMNFPDVLRVGSYPTKKVLEALNIPPKARDILSTYWSYLGVDTAHLSFLHYTSMVSTYVKLGAHIPAHTSHELSVTLTERFRELGGEIRFNCRAEEFLFDNDRICGVRTSAGRIDCDMVLANINPDIIYAKMMPKSLVPEREKKLSNARQHRYGARILTMYLGLDVPYEELGIKDYGIFMTSTADSEKEYQNVMNGEESNNYNIFLCYNIANPDISPKGTTMCSFTTFTAPVDWEDDNGDTYFKHKNALAKRFIDNLKEKTGIDLAGHIEEISVATPLTFARYLGVPEGSVYGYETRDWDSIIARNMMIDRDYPIKGLIPIGTSGPRGDGYSSAYMCGSILADVALKQLDKKEGNSDESEN